MLTPRLSDVVCRTAAALRSESALRRSPDEGRSAVQPLQSLPGSLRSILAAGASSHQRGRQALLRSLARLRHFIHAAQPLQYTASNAPGGYFDISVFYR